MKHIKIFDTTLRDGEQSPGCSMHLSEKLEVAAQLERLGVDIIEAGFAISSPGDFESVKAVSGLIKNCSVASLCRAVKGDIDAAAEALKAAKYPRIHIVLATSPIHREFKLKMSKEQIVSKIRESVAYAKKFVQDVEFSAEDACRTELDYLAECFQAAVDSGATVINVPDTVGYCTPDEVGAKIKYLFEHVKNFDKIDVSAHNHNDLGMATANSLAMIAAGATQVECSVNGIGERAGNTSLEQIVMALKVRSKLFECDTHIDSRQLYKTSKLISTITGVPIPPTKPIVGANAFAHESGIHQHGVLANRETYEIINPVDVGIPENKIVLGKHSGRHALEEHCKALGYTLTQEALNLAFDRFKVLADKKKYVSDKDLEALLSGNFKSQPKYTLVNYSASVSAGKPCSGSVTLSVDGKATTASGLGNGPIDACIGAVTALLKQDIILADYSIQAVTEDADAQGEASVTVSLGSASAHGRGVSTDVVEASILAFVDGVNKLSV